MATTQSTRRQAQRWMAAHAQESNNATNRAESCAWALDHNEWLDDPDHWVWDLALDWCPEEHPERFPQ